jgi:Glycogen recognition site of AMP-activated protein kinase
MIKTNQEELIQRFVDQELTPEERVQFLSQIGRDESLRRRAIEREQLVLDAGRLPRPSVPDGFAASVLKKLPEAAPIAVSDVAPSFSSATAAVSASGLSSWRHVVDALVTPRNLGWNWASVAAVACLVALFGVEFMTRAGVSPDVMKTAATPPIRFGVARAAVTPAALPSGVASPAILVRLVIMQPGAKTVQVAGDFNGWNPARTALEQISEGAWAVTIPLKPGRYAYMFVVDGQRWIADPFAAEQKDDGFGSRNAVLDVGAPEGKPGASL